MVEKDVRPQPAVPNSPEILNQRGVAALLVSALLDACLLGKHPEVVPAGSSLGPAGADKAVEILP